jgi:hypothetical protein
VVVPVIPPAAGSTNVPPQAAEMVAAFTVYADVAFEVIAKPTLLIATGAELPVLALVGFAIVYVTLVVSPVCTVAAAVAVTVIVVDCTVSVCVTSAGGDPFDVTTLAAGIVLKPLPTASP